MKLLFVYELLEEHDNFWRDGLWAALKELEKDWEVDYLNVAKDADFKNTILHRKADFVLGWGNTGSKHFHQVRAASIGGRGGWCFGGGDLNDEMFDLFPVVFVENKVDLIKPNFKHAFGTNTDLFFYQQQPKIIDALYPAAFAKWKHQEIFADICYKENLKGLAVGYIQQNNLPESMGLVAECIDKGVAVMDWIPAKALVNLYNMSKEVIITADAMGGCQRTVLEAKACDTPVRIVSDSPKLLELSLLTDEQVRTEWNHVKYAEMLKEEICKLL